MACWDGSQNPDISSEIDSEMGDCGSFQSMQDEDKGDNSSLPLPGPFESLDDECPKSDNGQNAFKVQTNLIPKASMNDHQSELQGLGLDVYNQDDLEQGIMAQVDQVLAREEQERIKKMIERQMSTVLDDIKATREELERINKVIRPMSMISVLSKEGKRHLEAAKRQRENKLNQMKKLKAKRRALNIRLDGSGQTEEEDEPDEDLAFLDQALGQSSTMETEEERMIRTGEMTPFGTVMKFRETDKSTDKQSTVMKKPVQAGPSEMSEFEKFLMQRDDKASNKKPKCSKSTSQSTLSKLLTKNVVSNGFTAYDMSKTPDKTKQDNFFDKRDKKVYRRETDFSQPKFAQRWKRQYPKLEHNFREDPEMSDYGEGSDSDPSPPPLEGSDEEYIPDRSEMRRAHSGDSDDSFKPTPFKKKRIGLLKKRTSGITTTTTTLSSTAANGEAEEDSLGVQKGKNKLTNDVSMEKARDDGNLHYYEKRLKAFQKAESVRKQVKRNQGESDSEDDDTEFEGGFTVPGTLWNKLFGYQRTGVKWLWELHCQQAGGIVGDEMGLGKTIQMITFMASLKQSKITLQAIPICILSCLLRPIEQWEKTPNRYLGLGPTIIVCPATVMHQWVREFHKWWPQFRVAILHSSGTYTGSDDSLIQNMVRCHGVLITSFTTLVNQQDSLLYHDWHYIILDEGHKIRNPDAQVTIACKQFRTPHRIILSGSPIQNNLKELWSLFDFVFPGKLGTLPDFMAHFSIPIVQGGYSNATQVQVQTAYKCACVLRDTINPYLLRRMKADVKESINLPSKNEQVLFCRLTDEQRDVYQEYLDSKECDAILAGRYKVFAGLITLRKICNHPDLTTGGPRLMVGQSTNGDLSLEYGFWKRSGKLIVVEALLKLWKKQDQRVLLFSQSKQMLGILEKFVQQQEYSYLRMDGGTNISSRQPLINKFNSNPNIFIFLLTTRVGGLGVNLTGANRVVIFDPDWNPSTDTQARERAWRIGQLRQVTIYRLLTTGTIEEKIYHRQIFKQFLTNRVLKDPKQRRFFKSNDMYELFTLGPKDSEGGTETSAIFAGIGSDVNVTAPKVSRFDAMKKEALPVKRKQLSDNSNAAPKDKMVKMREMAKKLSQQMGKKKDKTLTNGNTESQSCGHVSVPKNGHHSIVQTSTNKLDESDDRAERKKKKKKSKRQKDAEFEGETIPHLSKSHACTTGHEDQEMDNCAQDAIQDDYVLHRLFKKTGIQGALQHDAVVNSSNADYALVEGEADRVAKEAAAALKRSRKNCQRAITGIPTWTGQRGSAGGPPPSQKPRFGQKKNSLLVKKTNSQTSVQTKKIVENKKEADPPPPSLFDGSVAGNVKSASLFSASSKNNVMSSGELLQRMRERNNITNADNDADDNDSGDDDDNGIRTSSNPAAFVGNPEDMELIADIRNFIALQCHIDGQASTQELLDEFGVKLCPGDSAKFKAMLRQICDFDRSHDVGIWHLKSAFR